MNAAVTMLAEAANRKNGGEGRAKAEPIATLGAHPTSGGEIKVMPGRYGPYVTDGATNATIPKTIKPEEITHEQAIELIDARVAKGPAKKGKAKKARRRKPVKKTGRTNGAGYGGVGHAQVFNPKASWFNAGYSERGKHR